MLIYTQIEYLWIYCLVSLSLWLIFFLLVYNSGQVDKQNFECCWCHAGGMIRYKISLLNNAFRHTEKRSRRKVKIKHTPCLVHTINNDTCLLVNRLFFLYNSRLSDTIVVWGHAWEARNNDSQVIRLCLPPVLPHRECVREEERGVCSTPPARDKAVSSWSRTPPVNCLLLITFCLGNKVLTGKLAHITNKHTTLIVSEVGSKTMSIYSLLALRSLFIKRLRAGFRINLKDRNGHRKILYTCSNGLVILACSLEK